MVYGTRSFNACPEPNQFLVLIPISLRSILILSSRLCLGRPKCLFPAGVPVKILKALLPSSILAKCHVHLSLLDLTTLTILGKQYELFSFSLWSLLHPSFASFLGPNIRLMYFLNVTHPHSTTGNISVLYFFNFQILREKSRRKKCLDLIIT